MKKNAIIISLLLAFCIPSTGQETRPLVVLATFSTSMADQTEGVKKNIAIACDRIDGFVMKPGTVFSFNDIVGEGSAANGFVDGNVLYREGTVLEPGGGLCQVSSTMFNAMLMAGCSIVERHRHYQPVTYVPLGLDATIKYGKKDLRMKNPHNQPLVISATVSDKSLSIVIRGRNRLPYTYEIVTEEEGVPLPFVNDENVRPGVSVYIYRNKMKDGKVLESFLMYKDFYPPVRLP